MKKFQEGDRVVRTETGQIETVRVQFIDGYFSLDLDDEGPAEVAVALMDAAMGLKVRNATYRSAALVSNDVASRDLKALVDAGLLAALGENKGRSYAATPRIKDIADQIRAGAREEIRDPFTTPFSPIEQQKLFGE